jgi:plastocyanin
MHARRIARPVALAASVALLATSALGPSVAVADEHAVVVVGQDYHFENLPTSVPAGTVLEFVNAGQEFHELAVARKNDDVTESWEELLAMDEAEVFSKVTLFGPLFANAGEPAPGAIELEQEGEYLAICFIPQGTAGSIELPDMSGPPDPDAPPPAGLGEGPPHAFLGMMQEFVVTEPGSSPGPLPEGPSIGRTIDIELTGQLQILHDGEPISELNVAIGETIVFRVTNTAGFDHNLTIGPPDDLANLMDDGLVGTPTFTEGTEEFTWVVPENAGELAFGCTVPGHFDLMNGTFVVGG